MKTSERLLGWVSGGLLLFCWLMVIRSYPALPPVVPIHFDAAGRPDNWGARAGIWVLPVLTSVLYVLFTLLHHYADRLPQRPGPGDPKRSLQLLRDLFLHLRFAVMLVMTAGLAYSLRAALGTATIEPKVLMPFTILVVLAPVLLFLFRVLRIRRPAPMR